MKTNKTPQLSYLQWSSSALHFFGPTQQTAHTHYFDPWTMTDWLVDEQPSPGSVAAVRWESLKGCWCCWGRGTLGEAKWVEGERACETPEFIQKLMARDRLQVTPPHSCPPHPLSPPILSRSGGGGTNKSGGLYDQTEDKKSEREWGKACVFPRHASSCETMIYAFLRTRGSENVTFNQAHREGSKC